jgi:hypothetical protein
MNELVDIGLLIVTAEPNGQEVLYKIRLSMISMGIIGILLHFYFYKLILMGVIVTLLTNKSMLRQMEKYVSEYRPVLFEATIGNIRKLFPLSKGMDPVDPVEEEFDDTDK